MATVSDNYNPYPSPELAVYHVYGGSSVERPSAPPVPEYYSTLKKMNTAANRALGEIQKNQREVKTNLNGLPINLAAVALSGGSFVTFTALIAIATFATLSSIWPLFLFGAIALLPTVLVTIALYEAINRNEENNEKIMQLRMFTDAYAKASDLGEKYTNAKLKELMKIGEFKKIYLGEKEDCFSQKPFKDLYL